MRSKIAKKILSETPDKPHEKVELLNVNPLEDELHLMKFEINFGFNLKPGDFVTFTQDSEHQRQIYNTFLRIQPPAQKKLWIESRNHILAGIIEVISFTQPYYLGPAIQINNMWFPIALIAKVNGNLIDWEKK